MKGDKGEREVQFHSCSIVTNVLCSEFSGTLLGFDDYVSTFEYPPQRVMKGTLAH